MSKPKVWTRDELVKWFDDMGFLVPSRGEVVTDALMGLCVETKVFRDDDGDDDEAHMIATGEIRYSNGYTGDARLALVIAPDASPVSDGPSDDAVALAKVVCEIDEAFTGRKERMAFVDGVMLARRILAAQEASDDK
jgi:hypothetical protein